MVRPRVARGFVNQRFDFARWPLDTLIQPAPVSRQILDDAQHARQEHIGARREDSLVKACGCNARVDLCPLWTDRKNRDLGERLLLAAGSTDRCNTFCELLSWGLIEQGLSRPFIELPCDRAEPGLAMQGQIGATRKILAQQSVGVFV